LIDAIYEESEDEEEEVWADVIEDRWIQLIIT
jgi:hypothetical protein